MKKTIFIIPLLLLSCYAQAATVSWSSTSKAVDKNAVFSLDIVGLDFMSVVNGGGVNISFDPNVVNIVSVSIDETVWEFGGTGIDTGTINNVTGSVDGIMVNTFKGVTGNFTVATVNFQIIGAGGSSTDLTLSELAINPWASGGNMINPAFINAGINITPDPIIDSDDDGIDDTSDNCPSIANNSQTDTDNDGTGDTCDTDDDNDSLTDAEEAVLGSNPLLTDTDGDGTDDNTDAFPNDATETTDTDSDGVGDNMDAFPNDIAASIDEDNNGNPDAWNASCNLSCQQNSGLILDDTTSSSGGSGGALHPILLALLTLLVALRRRKVCFI